MASNCDSQIKLLVYNYLLKTCPKAAKLFSKCTESKTLPPNTPALEDLLIKSLSKTTVTEVKNSSFPKTPLKPALTTVQNSSSSDSDSESETTQNVAKLKGKAKLKKLSPKSRKKQLPAKKQSSSDETSSEDEKETLKKSPVKQQASKGSASQERKSSSSEDSSSDSGLKAVQKQTTPKANNWVTPISKFADMTDSSSESEDENKIVSLAKKPVVNNSSANNANVKGKDSSSSESEDDSVPARKEVKLSSEVSKATLKSPAKKQDSSSSDSSSDSEKEVPKVLLKQNAAVQKEKQKTSKKSSSSESSSDSDEGKNNQSKVMKSQLNSKSKGLATPVKQASSSDDSSSDSEARTSKQSNIKPPLKKVDSPLMSKNASIGKVNFSNLKGKDAKEADSSSDTSSDEEPKVTIAVKTVAPLTERKTSSSSDSEQELSEDKDLSKKSVIALKKDKSPVKKLTMQVQKQASSSSEDSSSDSESSKKQSLVKPTAVISTPFTTPGKKKNNTDCSERSLNSDKKVAKNSALKMKNEQANKKVVTKSSNPKNVSSSSDSSSETDEHPSGQSKVNVGTKPTVSLTKTNVSASKDSSSDDSSSDSEEENKVTKSSTATQQNKMKSAAKPVKKQESSSEDSDSESDSKPGPSLKSNNSPSLTKKFGTPSKVNALAVNNKKQIGEIVVGKSPNQRKVSSSSDSSSDSEQKTSTPVVQKNLQITKSESSDSDSSDSDAPKKTVALQSKSPVSMQSAVNGKGAKRTKESSSDSSDSEPAAKLTNANPSLSVKIDDSSSDEDASNDVKSKSLKRKVMIGSEKKKFPDQLPTQPQKKQKITHSFAESSFSENTPVTSDSTKKRRGSSPFRRIKDENFVVDQRLQKSSAEAKHYIPSLGASKGKQFRHEKTKKKRNNSAGKIDMSVNSIKFD